MHFDILTLFPEVIGSYANASILGRAQKAKKITVRVTNIRDFALDKHKTVDDKPYGGGAGMVMKVEPIYRALKGVRAKRGTRGVKIILTSASGKPFTQKMAREWAKLKRLVIVCGHYEGVDARVAKFIDEEVSIGPYVLTGGEAPALVIMDAVARNVPGVLGNAASLAEESWNDGAAGEYPQYTRPEVLKIEDIEVDRGHRGGKGKKIISLLRVPTMLLSGDHKKIKEWREKYQKKVKKAAHH